MLKKGSLIIKRKSLEEFLPTQSTIKSNFHQDTLLKAKIETCHDLFTSRKIELKAIEDKLTLSSKSIKKGEEIEQIIKYSKQLNSVRGLFKQALRHYCFYDIIDEQKDKVTIIFLPLSTSDKKILCGIKKFDKELMYINEVNNFYITRLLFQKTMD
jgi:hypothetical protein